jgi:hypothetical protein
MTNTTLLDSKKTIVRTINNQFKKSFGWSDNLFGFFENGNYVTEIFNTYSVRRFPTMPHWDPRIEKMQRQKYDKTVEILKKLGFTFTTESTIEATKGRDGNGTPWTEETTWSKITIVITEELMAKCQTPSI